MAKVNYNDFDDELNSFPPCWNCRGEEFAMDWGPGIYVCQGCGKEMIDEPVKVKVRKKKIKRFKGYEGEEEIY
tara:strand:+ start:1123 stop:1341 length:219 start_codon:yes stop_codon:yes gene_type:complete